jgi:hypothetical protein
VEDKMTKINKMTKMLVSLLLVSLAVLAPVSALELGASGGSGNNGNPLIGSGGFSVILNNAQVTNDNGQVELTFTTDNSATNNAGDLFDFDMEIQLSGDGINGVNTKTIPFLSNGNSLDSTWSISFALDEILAEGTHSLNLGVNVLTTSGISMDSASELIELIVGPAVPTNMEPNLITADLDEDNLNPGDVVELTIDLENGLTDYEDVNVEARILDSNNERVGDRVEADIGHLETDTDETVTMSMALPSDLDTGVYTVEIVVTGDVESGSVVYQNVQLDAETLNFDVERHDHSLTIDSVEHNSNAEAGDTYSVAVTVTNNGLNYEENVVITVSMAGTTTTSSVFAIDENDEIVQYFNLNVPSDAQNTEVLTVLVNGEDTSARYTANVNVGASATVSSAGLSATVDSVSKNIGSEGSAYMITLENNDDSTRTVTISVGGVQGWASTTITPATLTLAPGSSGVVSVYVTPSSSAEGTNAFTVYVSEGNQVISSVGLTANVEDAANTMMTWILAGIALILAAFAYNQRVRPATKGRRRAKKVYY